VQKQPLATLATAFAIAALLAGAPAPAHAANDPDLRWHSIETPHFRITYNTGEEEVARHVADLAEGIYARLSPAVGWEVSERTEVLLTDQTDSANGSATALPYNAVRLNVTAPDDLSPLGDVDDWYLELFTHEFTHILHVDHVRGLPWLANKIIGKTFSPNQVEPRWMLEGLAVFEESSKTSGGRLRSSQWNMYMRADVLENNVATLDQFSNNVRRWPQGNLWYLYGSFFMRWIAETYGEDALRRFIDDYAWQIVPFAVNRSMRRATGRTFDEMYPAWVDSMRRQYGAQAGAVRAAGLREGTRITHVGQSAQHPRWIPERAFPGHGGEILYMLDDGHDRAGLYRLPVTRDAAGNVTASNERARELMIRTSGVASASFAPDGTVYFNSGDVTKNLFVFDELFALPAGARSPSGMDGKRTRLTYGWRASDPDVSPDGRRVVFTTNHRGTTYLQIADLTADGGVAGVHALVPSGTFDQAFTPRWSPDGIHVAYSAWTRGGFRDVRIVDTRDGTWKAVTRDRAIDGGPSFSADGRWLFFHSDRSGVMNVLAYELSTGALKQVTNVVNGAYQPDGKTLAYLGYTSAGFDLFAMRLDPASWPDAAPYVDDRPSPPPPPVPAAWELLPYNALHTLVPRRYSVRITPGNFGQSAIVTASGTDIAGHHAVAASMTIEAEKPELQGSLSYSYGRLPVDLDLSLYRNIAPRGGLQLGPSYTPTWIQETVGFSSGVSYALPRAFDAQYFNLQYSFARIAGELPTPADKLDPYETPVYPTRGTAGVLHLGWAYSNAESYLWSVGPERGFSMDAALDVADRALGGEFGGYTATAKIATYFRMPWLSHHALALHASTGTSGGSYPGRGSFYVGGFVDLPLIDVIRSNLIQGGLVLRGYPVVSEVGRSFALFNGEYRFPIVNIDRGQSTLPFFVNRISGAAFVDYGSAFDDATSAKFKTGTGAELWFDTTLGYVLGFTFRLGYAHGWASEGMDKVYFVAAVPY
jgi:hypothetical protein